VKYDYNEWRDVNFDYLLVSVIVIHYQLSLQKKVMQTHYSLVCLKDTIITQSRRVRFTINLSQLRSRDMSVDLRC